ncbi:MAG: FAD-dependent oxidoreductase, partial [Bacilli bacterium]|nr:FAD-dependent oxidoreductase [Bacilli bacterium]
MNENPDVIIIGGGPAAMSSALYLLRAGKKVLILEKEAFGGQIAKSP